MAFQKSNKDKVESIAALFGEKLGSVAGYISTKMPQESVQEKVRSTFTKTVDRVDCALNKIEVKSAEILENVSSELKQLPEKAVHKIEEIMQQADERFSTTVQQGTYYLIDFAGVVKSSFAELRK